MHRGMIGNDRNMDSTSWGKHGLNMSIFPVRVQNIAEADQAIVTNWLKPSDSVIVDYSVKTQFDNYTKQTSDRSMAVVKANDSDISGIMSAATTYGVKRYMYNPEGAYSWTQIRDFLSAFKTALTNAGDTHPVMFCPILSLVDNHAADYNAVLGTKDGWWLQMWNPTTFPDITAVPDEVETRVNLIHATKAGCPIYIQINSYTFTVGQIVTCARKVSKIPGVTAISLWFQAPANWTTCKKVIWALRP